MDHGVVRELGRIEPGHGERHLGGEERRVAEGRVSRGGGGVGGRSTQYRSGSLGKHLAGCGGEYQERRVH